jgi:hypothetical protein
VLWPETVRTFYIKLGSEMLRIGTICNSRAEELQDFRRYHLPKSTTKRGTLNSSRSDLQSMHRRDKTYVAF